MASDMNKAYDEGRQAFDDGLGILDNPYHMYLSVNRYEWEDGYTDRRAEYNSDE